MNVNVNNYDKLVPGTFVPTPPLYVFKNVVANILSYDQKSFKYAIGAHLFHHNPKYYPHPMQSANLLFINAVFDWSNITFPVTLKDIDTFEKNNENIYIDVFKVSEYHNTVNAY